MHNIQSQSTDVKAYIGMAISTMIIGLSFVFVKIGLTAATPLDVLAHRFNAALAGLLICYLTGLIKRPKFNKHQLRQLLYLSLFYPLLFFGLQAVGLQYTTASEAGIVSATTPIFTLLLAMLILKERNTPIQILGVILSIAGTCYIFLKNGTVMQGNSLKGNILILLSVLSIVFYYILGRKINHQYRSIDITAVMLVGACLIYNVCAIGYHLHDGTIQDYYKPLLNVHFMIAVVYLGVLSSFVTSVLNNYALMYIPASQVAVLNTITPIISVVGGTMILGEHLYLYHYIGAALVLIGVMVTIFFKNKE